jgi:hypothetical protein
MFFTSDASLKLLEPEKNEKVGHWWWYYDAVGMPSAVGSLVLLAETPTISRRIRNSASF